MAVALSSYMKFAISHWQERISPVFDVADELLLVDVRGGRVLHRQALLLSSSNPFVRAGEMADAGAQWLICGAISLRHEQVLRQVGIRIIGFSCGALEDVLAALPAGGLNGRRFKMPGCHRRAVRFRGSSVDSVGPVGSGRGPSSRPRYR